MGYFSCWHSINWWKKCNYKTGTLTKNFLKPAGWENPYIKFYNVPKDKLQDFFDSVKEKNRSTINKGNIARLTKRIFELKNNKSIWTIMNYHPEPLPWTSSGLRGEQICMPCLYTTHIKCSNTPRGKFQYKKLWYNQWDNQQFFNQN